MSVSLTLQQTRTADAGGTYTVVNTVTAATGIPTQVFVYAFATSAYDHIASPYDILNFPTSPIATSPFYRQASVSLTYSDVPTANSAAGNIKTGVSQLVTAYGAAVPTFVGSDTTTYTG